MKSKNKDTVINEKEWNFDPFSFNVGLWVGLWVGIGLCMLFYFIQRGLS